MSLLALALLAAQEPPEAVRRFLADRCLDCHDADAKKGGLDLQAIGWGTDAWVKVHDRVHDGEMPPPGKDQPTAGERAAFLEAVARPIADAQRARAGREGRAKVRRLNRFEYENVLREGLDAPWLLVADRLPEDGTAHLFNKIGERLDVSHVQMAKYLEVAEHALRAALATAAHPTRTERFYAREERVFQHYLRYRFGQNAATRAAIPLLGTTPEPDIIRGKQPVTVGAADPERREREAMGYVSGTYAATTKYDFTRVDAPIDGRYRLRMKSYTFLAGPNGADGGPDHGLTGGNRAWWRPSRTVAFPGTRSEPVTLYALADSGDSRWLAAYDALPKPAVVERDVFLKKGENIRPDAARLVRTRPGWKGNPNAAKDGIPGVAFNWLEVEGPIHDGWPPAPYRAIFDDLPFEAVDGRVRALSERPDEDARRLLTRFLARMVGRPSGVETWVALYRKARELGDDFTDAMIGACAAVLCSPDFLFLDVRPGPLDGPALADRLSYFLWNGPPDPALRADPDPGRHVDRLLDDPRSERFVNAFLDYWLDLRDIHANAPDNELYPDYYLDDLLTESSVLETRRFFRELVGKDLPAGTLIHADFAFVNERLAEHYGLPRVEGVALRRVPLPEGSPRGGLLGQASLLRLTANGTTTSPVLRGAWIAERLLGIEVPPPPSGVEAIEPDIRGAVTIREQLDKHRALPSCGGCHAKFDPIGFALESFDVAGGWRERYRAVGAEGDPVEGFGKNGHAFVFRLAQPVDCAGELRDGRRFTGVRELKGLLLADERAIARNLANRFVVYATGAPVSFADRAEVEAILDGCADGRFGVRSLIRGIVRSPLFRNK